MTQWRSIIVDGSRILEGQPLDLTAQIQQLSDAGWALRFLLPNGVNRWTIVCSKEE